MEVYFLLETFQYLHVSFHIFHTALLFPAVLIHTLLLNLTL